MNGTRILKEYRNSVRLVCKKCRNGFLCKKNSRCADTGICSPCLGGDSPELKPAWLKQE